MAINEAFKGVESRAKTLVSVLKKWQISQAINTNLKIDIFIARLHNLRLRRAMYI